MMEVFVEQPLAFPGSAKYTLHETRVNYAVCSMHYAVCTGSVHYVMCTMQCEPCSVNHAVCTMHCALYSTCVPARVHPKPAAMREASDMKETK